MGKKGNSEFKKHVRIKNKKASYEYEFIETYLAGIVLKGTEIKSIRLSKVSLQEAFCIFKGSELYVKDMHIAPYEMGTFHNHEAKTDRKLLLTKRELRKLKNNLKDDGLTIIPTELFISEKGWVKVRIALARGKKLHDKRESIKEKSMKREIKKYVT